MKRRELIKRLAQLAVGITITRLASETPAQGWASRYARGTTLVYFGDGPAFEIIFKNGQPLITNRELAANEHRELNQYRQEIDRHLPQRIGTVLGDGKFRLRGWIYNGRYPGEWRMSVEQV